jgi:cytochrome c
VQIRGKIPPAPGWWGALWLAALALVASPARAQDLEAARQQFLTSCGTCHSADHNTAPRQGPNLATVYGRHVAALPDYKYSEVLKGGDWVWSEATLDPWIENAQAAHPGTVMNYRQANPDKRQLIIAYLKSLQAN